ncbi:MAG: hypothetical protein HY648_06285 [Acidobacteria bacterium]|nr:hypothetical protein [Acidobacteriota bacterium]
MRSGNQDQAEKGTLINYGRPSPPVETRWKPGQSGNPKGRPKKEESIVGLLKDLVNALCPTDPERRSYAELLVRSLVHQGLKGNLGAIKEVFNRLVGRVPFPIERLVTVSNESNQKTSRDGNSPPPGSRSKLSLEEKNEILEVFGIEPIGKQANHNENGTEADETK